MESEEISALVDPDVGETGDSDVVLGVEVALSYVVEGSESDCEDSEMIESPVSISSLLVLSSSD